MKYLFIDAYLVRTVRFRLPGTSRWIDIPALRGIRVNPYTHVARIGYCEVQLNKIDYLTVC